MKKHLTAPFQALFAALLLLSCSPAPHTLHVVTTGDVHGSFFDEPYVSGARSRTSLMSVKHYVDSLRSAVGADNVLLLDAGDILQGDNAAYYYNYVAVDEPHILPRIASYMGYDAIVLGNHDIETGHAVYDRLVRELESAGVPALAGNALTPSGKPYFPEYAVVRKGGLKVLVLGYDNANIAGWLSEELWSGMRFESLVPLVRDRVEALSRRFRPDVVVAVVHSGTGEGDGSQLESQGLDIYAQLTGADVLVCAHDHRSCCESRGDCCLLNAGARAGYVGHATVSVSSRRTPGRNSVAAEVVRLDKRAVDTLMREAFRPEFDAVKAFTLQPVGSLAMPLVTRDAYCGMSDYINFVHTVQLGVPEAQISFAAPLTYNGTVSAGQIVYNDLFTIYPFENQLFVLKMSGAEIVSYLEESYDRWIVTPGDHVFNIEQRKDERTGADRWSFAERSYNFDSAAGLRYTVDVTAPRGSRICVTSLADGSAFDPAATYNVAMTSYRASGGGFLLEKGCGIDAAEAEARIVARYPEIREMIYSFLKDHPDVTPALVGDSNLIGSWRFVPEQTADALIAKDMALVF